MPAGVSAYVPLANTTLASNSATVSFSSISGSYRDLILIAQGRSNRSGQYNDLYNITFNGSTSGYSRVVAYGSGTSTGSFTDASISGCWQNGLTAALAPSGNLGFLKMQVMDYSATDRHKTLLNNEDNTANEMSMSAYRWANTSAITSMTIAPLIGTLFLAGSTFSLFGVSA